MVDKVTDFFKEIKERVSNPFLSSFAISWLISNWKITVGLLSYKLTEYNKLGYIDFIDYFKKNTSATSLLIYPIGIALAYTFIFPFFRNGILIFNTWIKTWGGAKTLAVAKKGSIGTKKYIDLQEKHDKEVLKLSELIRNEEKTVQENDNLKAENSEVRLHNVKQTKAVEKLEKELSETLTRLTNIQSQHQNEIFERTKLVAQYSDQVASLNNLLKHRVSTEDMLSKLNGVWQGHIVDAKLARTAQFRLKKGCIGVYLSYPNRVNFFGRIVFHHFNPIENIMMVVAVKIKYGPYKISIDDPNHQDYPLDVRLFQLHSIRDGNWTGQDIIKGTMNGLQIDALPVNVQDPGRFL